MIRAPRARWQGTALGSTFDPVTRLKKKLDQGQDDLNTHVGKPHSRAGSFLRLASKVGILNAMANRIILTRVQPHPGAMNATVDVDAFDAFRQKRSAANRAIRDFATPSGRRDRSTAGARKSSGID